MILEKTKAFVTQLLSDELAEQFVYHTIVHTELVVKAANEILENTNCSDEEKEIVLISAWFHDVGYTKGCEKHELSSISIAEEFLTQEGYSIKKIEQVKQCILATTMPQQPKSKMDEVLCDADMYHLANAQYLEQTQLLHKEFETIKGQPIDEVEWGVGNIEFFKEHRYFTSYGQTILEKQKQKNLKALKKKYNTEAKDDKYAEKLEKQVVELKNKVAKAKTQKPDRGIETMFRTTSKNHLQLSAMADTKANIMISINSILLSVVVTILMRKLENNPHLIIPTFAITFVCLVTIVLAILATRPNVSSGKFTTDDILKKKTNLLFFGNFHGMEPKEYIWGMKEMMKDADYLYTSMIRDIYYLGIVLGKKYKLLRICYTFFMFGIVISVMLFVISIMWFAPEGSEIENFF